MCRDGTRGAARAARRTTHWQRMAKTEPIQREMARLKAAESFNTRKTSFVEQLQAAMRPKILLNRWARDARRATSLSQTFTELIVSGYTLESVQSIISELPFLITQRAAVVQFVSWLFQHAQVLRDSQTQQRTPNPNRLAARRMHLLEPGRVGKNYPLRPRQVAAHARTKSIMLARGLFRGSHTVCTVQNLPRFITQAVDDYNRQKIQASELSHASTVVVDQNLRGASTKKVCHFFRLPAELRNIVYEYTFGYDSSEEVNLLTAVSLSPLPALPQTCKQIGRECGLMYLRNFQQFWRSTRFYIDASCFPTGWHIRHELLRLPEREIDQIRNLRISFVAKNGGYNAVKKGFHWHVKRVGGPHPSGRGAWKSRLWGADELVFVYRYPFITRDFPRKGRGYGFDVVNSTTNATLFRQSHGNMRRFGVPNEIPVRGQIAAIIEKLHRFL